MTAATSYRWTLLWIAFCVTIITMIEVWRYVFGC